MMDSVCIHCSKLTGGFEEWCQAAATNENPRMNVSTVASMSLSRAEPVTYFDSKYSVCEQAAMMAAMRFV